MFHFVPAWYHPERTWYDKTSVWYRRAAGMDFDDTINHVKMFQYIDYQSSLLILNYMPNLRYFLHRYDLFEQDYYAIFDVIQNTESVRGTRFDFKQLNWSKKTRFIYTPFAVIAKEGDQKIAQLEFGQDGQLIWIDFFKESHLDKTFVFDDRGFLSSILERDESGIPYLQTYFDAKGIWVLKESLVENESKVVINESQKDRFKKLVYQDLTELIIEKCQDYYDKVVEKDDTLIYAYDKRHQAILANIFSNHQKLVSVFSLRNKKEDFENQKHLLDQNQLIICDHLNLTKKLETITKTKVEHLSPFDTRLSLGKSQHIKESIVYFVMDGLDDAQLSKSIDNCYQAMLKDSMIEIVFVSYERDYSKRMMAYQFLEKTLAQFSEEFMHLEEQQLVSFEIIDAEEVKPRVAYHYLESELDVIKYLNQARLIVDLSETPDLYTQIAGISAGIPQVNTVSSEYVEDRKNGYILEDISQLKDAFSFYFDGLANWNQALVYAVQKINDYTGGNLVARLLAKSKE
ncbi:accessory Sec system protein Asp1 [Streptococcus urinalis FB127-CNA-2]|uniref:Accessory Sec system protein Asp1 n=1 Tax=Streptococcus urinalis 2285-97 TaxID=764291 RepID=G5KHS8_9STRE|nr:accessory Sec system protein Asp1 [Streptococcus urinalis]EHJ55977.1 accessory Sec system protein Asp1 [Streptococcus urinalis 2285-97]EKS20496.1 accessory Sec system protein Asp1 [Streptococcus urinalis FB127-CNA-2]VEF31190.1 Accessory secretory protein Asp1 [Streptococcus urinalis]